MSSEELPAPPAEAVEEVEEPTTPGGGDAYYSAPPTHTPGEVDDVASLVNLNEDTLLSELQVRYGANKIYTWVSDILIAVNPFKPLGIYGPDMMAKYTKVANRSALPPHVYFVSDALYHNLFKMKQNQCAVISGESGAGKTESAKFIIKHIIELAPGQDDLEQQILKVSPLLEAFGNAQTVMNDNSSRFGKYTRLLFDAAGSVLGVQLSEYLLEKSRVVEQAEGERNFHVMYYIFAGDKERYHLTKTEDFMALHGMLWEDNEAMYKELCEAISVVGFSEEEKDHIHLILAGCLHLSNVQFSGDERSYLKDKAAVNHAAHLLGIDAAALEQAFLGINTVTRGERIRREYKPDQAYDCRDALSKALYGSLFGWIVSSINQMLAPALHSPSGTAAEYEIGVLDIFGFENFKSNGFEQICINFAHEKLQFFFNRHTFQLELEEYAREGIDGREVSFQDNGPLIELFLAKIGVLTLLDEECTFPRATDQSFVDKMNKNFKDHERYTVVKMGRGYPAFAIEHFPGTVEYNATNFLEKNKDNLAADIITLMQNSTVGVIQDVFCGEILNTGQIRPRPKSESGKPAPKRPEGADTVYRKTPTLSAQFKNSLSVLINRMNSCFPHFVRCIKPNTVQQAENFQEEYVKTQLLYTGVLEVTRIRQEGYSWRPAFADFVERYKIIGFPVTELEGVAGTPENCEKILKVAGVKTWAVGHTKMFLKYFHVDYMEKRLKRFFKDVLRTQCAVRRHNARKAYNKLLARQKMDAAQRAELERQEAEEAARLEEIQHQKNLAAAELAAQAKAEAEAQAAQAAQLKQEQEGARRRAEEEAQKAKDELEKMASENVRGKETEEMHRKIAEAEALQVEREQQLREAEEARLQAEKQEAEMVEWARQAEEARKAKEESEKEATRIQRERLQSRKKRREDADKQAKIAAAKAEAERLAAEEARRQQEEAERLAREAEAARDAQEQSAAAEKQAALLERLKAMEEEARKAKEAAAEQARRAEEARKARAEAEAQARKAEEERQAEEIRLAAEKAQEEAERRAADWTNPDFELTSRLKKLLDGRDVYSEEVSVEPRVAKGWMAKMKARDISSFLGFVVKRDRKKNWKRRYFVFDLDNKTLSYYEDIKLKKLKTAVDMTQIVRVFVPPATERADKSMENLFVLETSDKTFFCKAPTPEAMELWLAIIGIVCKGQGGSSISLTSQLSVATSRQGSSLHLTSGGASAAASSAS